MKYIRLFVTFFISQFMFINALADSVYQGDGNKLTIPYVHYKDQYYQVEMTYQSLDKLILNSATVRDDVPQKSHIVPVYNDLSFHLSAIQVGSDKYQADVEFLGDDQFKITHLSAALKTTPGSNIFSSKHFRGSGICEDCHDGISDGEGKDVSIIKAWESTLMANASKDPFWKAKVESELSRTPAMADEINDTCSRCHTPMASVESKKQGTDGYKILEDGVLSKDHPLHDVAMEGVSCTLCHQIKETETFGSEAGFSGGVEIESFANKADRIIYGPFEDVLTRPMQEFANFTPTYSPHIKASEFCASCHDLKTPYTDEAGNVLSTGLADQFPEQMPYSEWLHSDYAEQKSCQQCHMKRSNDVIIAAQPPHLTTTRNAFAQHSFLSGNKLMLDILDTYRESLGVTAKDFSVGLANAETLMAEAADLNVISRSYQEGTLAFILEIRSRTGHKLPSAYPSRRIILHVTVQNEQGEVVFESGKVNPDGSVVNLDSDMDPTRYEPHYKVITSPDQVQVYEAIMENYKGEVTYTLLRAKQYKKDNRLLPDGFDKKTASREIRVAGLAADDGSFSGGGDRIKYELSGLVGQGGFTIEAELIYQVLGYAFARDLFLDQTPQVKQFKQMFNASDLKSDSMIKRTFVIN